MDLKLLHSIHLECWRGVHDPIGERICHVGLQKANVEHRVNFDGTWQFQTKHRGPNLLQDLKRTSSPNIKLGRGTRRGHVATQQPDFLAHHQIWGRTASLIG